MKVYLMQFTGILDDICEIYTDPYKALADFEENVEEFAEGEAHKLADLFVDEVEEVAFELNGKTIFGFVTAKELI